MLNENFSLAIYYFIHFLFSFRRDLSGNKLTTLRPGMFDGIKRVIGLFLQDNEISVIENNTFRANNFRNDFGVDITVL